VTELSRRQVLGLGALGAAATVCPPPARAAGPRPNIVWFRSEDNHASFIGAYGNPLAVTPAIDGLAREGVLFKSYFTTSPVCAPSKLAILTGVHEASLGPGHHMRAQAILPAWLNGFATHLKRAGYWSTEQGAPGANPDHNCDMSQIRTGYDDTSGDWTKAPAGRPFFALLGSSTSHETSSFTPYPGSTDPAKVRIPSYQPDTEVIRRDRAHYMDAITRMDGEVADTIAQLKDAGVWDDTIFIYSSDHGGVLPRSKRFVYDSGLHAPLIIRFPRKWQHLAPARPGAAYRPPVSSIDLPATIVSLAGARPPSYFHGQAFAGTAVRPARRYAFSNRNRMDESIDFVRSAADERYRYIRHYLPHLPYGQHVQFQWLQAGMRDWELQYQAGGLPEVQTRFWRPKPAEELYDLYADPDEVRNLIHAPQHQGRIRDMRKALDQHMLRINDNGFIPEGMALEGWDASRRKGAYPLERLLALGRVCIQRNPRNLPALLAALGDRNEVVRYWGAMGLSMLGPAAKPATAVLTKAMTGDPSAWVKAQASDALARSGSADVAVPVLAATIVDFAAPMSVRLQSTWSLAYLGDAAIAAVPQLTVAGARQSAVDDYPSQCARYALRVVTGTYVPAP